MAVSLKRWILIALIVAIIFASFVAAQDDDDDETSGKGREGAVIQDVEEGVDAEEAADEIASDDDSADKESGPVSGIKAFTYFPTYADLKIPAGERIEILVPVSNAAGNPSHEVALVAGSISLLDHSRFIQNFSAQVYQRVVEGGETATIKYSVTPDAMLEPMEYAFVVVAYLRNADNSTVMITAYNGTMVVSDPLGFDFKGLFTLVAFVGGLGGAGYWYMNKQAAARPAPRKAAAAAKESTVETGTKNSAYDLEFVDKSHLAFLNKRRDRSASPKK